jgi:hypothetical protein
MPLIGAGTGGGDETDVLSLISDEIARASYPGRVVLVRYIPPSP